MGDYLLMKTIILFLFITSVTVIANDKAIDLSWVDEQVEAIKPARDGELNSNITKIKDPFIFLKKNYLNEDKKTSKNSKSNSIRANKNYKKTTNSGAKSYKKRTAYSNKSFVLSAIINKSARINGKWYKLNDRVKGYKITDIKNKTVTLKRKSKTLVLSTASKNSKLKFKK